MAGGLMGGGASGDIQDAVNAQVKASEQAAEQSRIYGQKALDFLGTQNDQSGLLARLGTSQAAGPAAPYALSGYNALDLYNQTLGMPTPQAGSASLAAALQQFPQGDAYESAVSGSLGQLRSILNTLAQQGVMSQREANEKMNEYQNSPNVDMVGMAEYLESLQSRLPQSAAGKGAQAAPPISSFFQSKIKGIERDTELSGEQRRRLLTQVRQQAQREAVKKAPTSAPNGLAQGLTSAINAIKGHSVYQGAAVSPGRTLANQYRGGQVPMSTAPSTEALSKFFQTPGYQLRFGGAGAATDPNASVLARFAQSPEAMALLQGYDPNATNLQNFGRSAQAQLMGGYDPSRTLAENFQVDPGYEFALEQGQRALTNQAATRGLLESGAFAKDLVGFGQGMANQQYGGYLQRLNSAYGGYQGMLGGSLGSYMSSLTSNFGDYQNRLAAISGQGLQPTMLASNQISTNLGNLLPQLQSRYGETGAGIYTGIGSDQQNALLAAGAARAGGSYNQANMSQQQSAGMGKLFGGAGQAIGSAFGGPVGGAIGSLAGGLLGGLF